jgi:hypothetical protein
VVGQRVWQGTPLSVKLVGAALLTCQLPMTPKVAEAPGAMDAL